MKNYKFSTDQLQAMRRRKSKHAEAILKKLLQIQHDIQEESQMYN